MASTSLTLWLLSVTNISQKFSYPELVDNASILIIAGSETTATTLSGVTYMLLSHPEILQKTLDEVRSSFSSEAEIDLLSVQKLSYMMAVLQETLRMYPPVAASMPRRAQPGGDTICGQYVPEDVSFISRQRHSLTSSNEIYRLSWGFGNGQRIIMRRISPCPIPLFRNDGLAMPGFRMIARKRFSHFHSDPRNCIGKKSVSLPKRNYR